MELVERKEEARWLWSHFLVSQRRICELMNVAESSQRYVSWRNDEELRARLVEAARPKWGYRRLQLKLEAKGMLVNHKQEFRVSYDSLREARGQIISMGIAPWDNRPRCMFGTDQQFAGWKQPQPPLAAAGSASAS